MKPPFSQGVWVPVVLSFGFGRLVGTGLGRQGLIDKLAPFTSRLEAGDKDLQRDCDLQVSGRVGAGAVMRRRVCAGALVAAGGLLLCLTAKSFAQGLPAGFVHLRDIDPSILQDIRYATANNFTGKKLPGYEAGECVVRREVALALGRVQQELKPRGLSLKMLDCYRPARASRAMLAWSREAAETAASRRYYPRLSRRDLFGLGYIAAYSGHSTGAAVDLTLVDLSAGEGAAFDPNARYADCIAPADKRAPEGSMDMGTGYDCFDIASHTRAAQIMPEQRRWRQALIAAMARQGFVSYFREWWHFSLPLAGRSAYDFPIRSGVSPGNSEWK